MRFASLFAAGFLAFGPPAAARADQDLDTQRLNREATALFLTVIKDVGVPTRPCELDSAWSSQTIPYEVAHRFLGLQAFADLRSPASVAPPSEVFGSIAKGVLCSEDEWTQYQTEHAGAQAAALRALPKDADPEPLWWRRDAFSFPIFDQTYNRAVVVHEGYRWRVFILKGTVMRAPPEGAGYAYIYERKADVWRQIDEIELYTAD